MKTKTKIKGLDKALKDFMKFGEEGEKLVSSVTKVTAKEIEANAKIAAPKNLGKLAQSISSVELDKLSYEVVVGVVYGGYVEFGTGRKVQIPSELSDEAAKFRGNGGSFDEGLKAIKDWCRQKGIEESAAYPIFISILKNGIEPQPFLYPAYVKGKGTYVKDLKHTLQYLVKKYE